jgi:Uma2 family endonuclease
MSAVSITDIWPQWDEPFTVEDLDRMPDDGRRYELIDGMLIVSPAPNLGHQRVDGVRLTRPPLLVAEVLSPYSVLRDLNLKKAAYERFGIPSYWVVDPDLDQPGLQAFELDDHGVYAEVAHVTGSETFRAARPFSVEIAPDRLVTKLPRR